MIYFFIAICGIMIANAIFTTAEHIEVENKRKSRQQYYQKIGEQIERQREQGCGECEGCIQRYRLLADKVWEDLLDA